MKQYREQQEDMKIRLDEETFFAEMERQKRRYERARLR
jgi:hypothetical protein